MNDLDSAKMAGLDQWDLIIRPQRAWWDLQLGALWRYRDLIRLMVWRDFVAFYKQTILGPLWYLIQPVLTTLVFTVVFDRVANLSTDGLPPFLFYLAGNTIWLYFAACLTATSNVFVTNAGLFGKVYFPRLAVPISIVISNLISLAIRFAVFILFLLYFWWAGADIQVNEWIFVLPVSLVIMASLGLGLGIIISALTTKYRDLQQLVGFGVQLLMYACPVIYPYSAVPRQWQWLLLVNPLTPVIETFRLGFLGSSAVSPVYLVYSLAFAVLVLLIGIIMFTRVENTFMDTV